MADPDYTTPTYGETVFSDVPDRNKLQQKSISPRAAQRLILDELDLDARESNNPASFATDHMDPEVDEIINRTLGKVFIDRAEYPRTADMGDRVARMIQHWYGGMAPAKKADGSYPFVGTPTIGSSEAIMLGLIAHRFNWEKKWKERVKTGVPATQKAYYTRDRPVMIWARNVHSCWHKYSKYYNGLSLVLDLKENQYTMDDKVLGALLDRTIKSLNESTEGTWDHTAGKAIMAYCRYDTSDSFYATKTLRELVCVVGCVAGTTFTPQADPIDKVNEILAAIRSTTAKNYPLITGDDAKIDIPIHVDAAFGGFCLPFTNGAAATIPLRPSGAAEIKWNFTDLPQVKSINVSNHKFGLVYPGMGTAVFRDKDVVDPELIFNITYLGSAFDDYTVNFSRGSAMVLAAYYNMVRLGKDGYKDVIRNCLTNARALASRINSIEVFNGSTSTNEKILEVISNTDHFPVVVFRDKRGVGKDPLTYEKTLKWTLSDLSEELAKKGWQIPAYPLPYKQHEKPDGHRVMRIVVRQDLSIDKLELLYEDIKEAIVRLEKRPVPTAAAFTEAKKQYFQGQMY